MLCQSSAPVHVVLLCVHDVAVRRRLVASPAKESDCETSLNGARTTKKFVAGRKGAMTALAQGASIPEQLAARSKLT